MKKISFILLWILLFNAMIGIWGCHAQEEKKIDSLLLSKRQRLDSLKSKLISHRMSSCIDKRWINLATDLSTFKNIESAQLDSVIIDTTNFGLIKKRFELLNEQTPLEIHYKDELAALIQKYLTHRLKLYQKLYKLSQFYFPLFEKHLDQYQIPLEIKYLAIVESALNPRAKSRVGASGLWQFMYGTAKQFNLRINSYVDQRYDPIKSTKAACKYLSQLFGIFGDWNLALAAYNAGPGNVSKAIRRSGGATNYWEIRPYLPRETANYVERTCGACITSPC